MGFSDGEKVLLVLVVLLVLYVLYNEHKKKQQQEVKENLTFGGILDTPISEIKLT